MIDNQISWTKLDNLTTHELKALQNDQHPLFEDHKYHHSR